MSSNTSFATPLPQSPRSPILEYRFPKPHHQYVLTGRSRAAWHTSFVIPQLSLLLDAGLCVNNLRPKHIFLTHGHSDHTLLSPAFIKRDDPPDFYCPAEMSKVFDDFILSKTMLNAGGAISLEDSDTAILDAAPTKHDHNRPTAELAWLGTHHTHGLIPGDVVELKRRPGITATAFACDHSVPCLGYVFHSTTHRLRPEYTGLPSHELRDMRKAGVELTAPQTTPVFAFLGDTTAATLASEPAWLTDGVSVVITECSFLKEEHRDQANRTKHTLWADLEPVVRKWPSTTFVLIHFSMRYTDAEVAQFFRTMEDCPANIVVWADPEDDTATMAK